MKTKNRVGSDSKIPVSYWDMFGIRVFGGGEGEVLKKVGGWLLRGEKRKWIATVNPEFVMRAVQSKDFMDILAETDLNVVDGIGLIWAKKVKRNRSLFAGLGAGAGILAGRYRDELAAGADLMVKMASLKAMPVGRQVEKSKSLKVFFLGGWGDRAKRTAESKEFRMAQTAWSPGEPEVENEEVIKQINEFKPDLLFVAYGMQKQEEWIYRNLKKIDVGVVMGVGRSFDYYSGDLKRAPNWVRRMGMEWLYSLIIEPKRWKRQLVLPKFIWKIIIS